MKPKLTLASFKRKVVTGARILCVENTFRPELNGIVRKVTKVKSSGFSWIPESGGTRYAWTQWPMARDVLALGEDEITFPLYSGSEHSLTLKVLPQED